MTEQDLPEMPQLDMELVKTNIPTFTNEKLCEMIIVDRYFGFGEKIAPLCMAELSTRRINGDPFNFEEYIEKSQKELPVLDLNLDVRNILQQAMNAVKKAK